MGRHDWFRRETWTQDDRAAFFARLERSRTGYHKGQYARIQALTLHDVGGPRYAREALELLDLILERWPMDIDVQLPQVHEQRAECLRDIGDDTGALAAYRRVFVRERQKGCVFTNAHSEFAWWIASEGKHELFDEAVQLLDEYASDGFQFPQTIYLTEGARALILHARGEPARAAGHARRAMEAEAVRHNGLRYHPTVGLARVRDGASHALLRRIAKG